MSDSTRADPAGHADRAEQLVAVIEEQERRLVFAAFGPDDAWRLGNILVDLARARSAAVTVDIRRHGQQLFHAALPGTSADNDAWIQRKVRTVDRYGHSSYLVGQRCVAQGTTFEASSRLDPDRYAAHGGAFPIILAGTGPVGTVTVSGLPQGDDHALVVTALESYLERPSGDGR
jgi:uncharacterized protein (UPF0303 family)